MKKLDISIISEKKEKNAEEKRQAALAAQKFLEENYNINVDYVIQHFNAEKLSTTKCAIKLGISPQAFLRLRKKYNIKPISIINNRNSKKNFPHYTSNKAIKKFYTKYQLQKIPQFELDLVKIRSAKSLKLPNKIDWKPRGRHSNGKLKARTAELSKLGIRVVYNEIKNNYSVYNKDEIVFLSKKEVDELNNKYLKLMVLT